MKLLGAIHGRLRRFKGQAMVEYTLVMAAIAVATFGAYQAMGADLTAYVFEIAGKI